MSSRVQVDTIQPKADHRATVIIFHGAGKVAQLNQSESRYFRKIL